MCSAKTEKEYLEVLLQQFSFLTVSQLKRADLLSVLEVSDVIKEREKLELERTRLALARETDHCGDRSDLRSDDCSHRRSVNHSAHHTAGNR